MLNSKHSIGEMDISTVAVSGIAEVGDLVRQARADQTALYPAGGRTMFDLGLPPKKPGLAVDLRGLKQIIDYPARDMTITVQAGITIASLQQVLAAEKQRLPVDIPLPELATLGGAIATNASGPRRFGHGTLRDYVIGISVINDEGDEVKGGGRVVKNVAGYDLMKLYTGSLGTLGIISQATLKLKPLPESAAVLWLPVSLDQAATILESMTISRTRPVVLDLLSPSTCQMFRAAGGIDIPGSETDWLLLIGFEDNFKAVTWQIQQMRQELPEHLRAKLYEVGSDLQSKWWTPLVDFPLWPAAKLSLKANLPPSAVPGFCRQAANWPEATLIRAHAGSGIVQIHCDDLALHQAEPLVKSLAHEAAAANGNLIATRYPIAWKSVLPVWGRSSPDRILMKLIKQKLDPDGVFNPGRFVDGI